MKKTSRFHSLVVVLPFLLVAGFCLLCRVAGAQSGPHAFSTLAGMPGLRHADGTNEAALFARPLAVATDPAGNIFVADNLNHVIRRVTPEGTNWVTTTILGMPGVPGYVDGANQSARFFDLKGMYLHVATTNLYFVNGHAIKKAVHSGSDWAVTTWAGGDIRRGASDGPGLAANFDSPQDLAVDSAGNIYVADTDNHKVRRVSADGGSWWVSTIAGAPAGQVLSGYANGASTSARFSKPRGIALDASGNLFVADSGNQVIRKLIRSGNYWVTSTLAGQPGIPGSTDGTNAGAQFNSPCAVWVDPAGSLFVASDGDNTLRKITMIGTNAVVTTIAGLAGPTGYADGTNAAARFNLPQGITGGVSGELYIADVYSQAVRTVRFDGTNAIVRTIAGTPDARRVEGTGETARFWQPFRMATGPNGDVYVADNRNHAIRRLTWTGTNWLVSTAVGSLGFPGGSDGSNTDARLFFARGVACDAGGALYSIDQYRVCRTVREGADTVTTTIAGLAGTMGTRDGTNSGALFAAPAGIAVDPQTNIFVSETLRIARITPVGTNWVTTSISSWGMGSSDGTNSVAMFRSPAGLAADLQGNIFVADEGNHTIRRIAPMGTNWVTTTIAGLAGYAGTIDGTNSEARFRGPAGIAVDKQGNLYVTESTSSTVRKVTASGSNWVVTTIGGLAMAPGYANGTGTSARFNQCQGIAVASDGTVLVADSNNDTIRWGRPVPALELSVNGDEAVCSWPLWASNFVLETSAHLQSPAAWALLGPGSPTSDALTLTNRAASSNGFYRLRLQ